MQKFLFCLSTICFSAQLLSALPEYTSAADTNEYRDVCKEAVRDENAFAHFKRLHEYTRILEHLGTDTGIPYLKIIKQQTPEFIAAIERFKVNDRIGDPRTDVYPEIGTISTTTLRYMKVASDLKVLFQSLNGKSIVEIGGGYGGQCLILSLVNRFKSYTIVDLPEPLELTRKYLERHHVSNVTYKTFDEAITDGSFDLVISNYAYSECVPEMRKKYVEEILSRSKRGYITGNGFAEELTEYLRPYGILCEQFTETPLTCPDNVLVLWR